LLKSEALQLNVKYLTLKNKIIIKYNVCSNVRICA